MACSCSAPEPKSPAPGFRRALWIALWVNLAMFVVEGIASLSSGSVSLMADAIDFFIGQGRIINSRSCHFKSDDF